MNDTSRPENSIPPIPTTPQKIVAIDFDHTIHDKGNEPPGHRMGPPIEGTLEALTYFRDANYKIVIFCFWATNEKNCETIAKWLDYFQIPFDDITNIKPNADAFIDNKAIRFTNWLDILNTNFND